MAIQKRKVGVVGVGHVGAHVAFNLGMMGIADEVLLCDVKESKVTSEVQDLNDAVMYMPCLLYTSPSPRDRTRSRMPSSA